MSGQHFDSERRRSARFVRTRLRNDRNPHDSHPHPDAAPRLQGTSNLHRYRFRIDNSHTQQQLKHRSNCEQVKSARRGHAEFTSQSSSSASSSTSNASAPATSSASELLSVIVTVSAVSFVLYCPFALTWSVMTGFGSLMSADLSSLLTLLRRFFLECSEAVHCLNLLIYTYHMRIFRRELVAMLGCRRWLGESKSKLSGQSSTRN